MGGSAASRRPRSIVAIGGGDLGSRQTIEIDREVVRRAGGRGARALFIPTASGDAEGYYDLFREIYTDLGCTTDVLWLLDRFDSHEAARELIESADLVYVGGGNTLKMMRRWRRLGIDVLLRRAWESGVVMSGLSAGAICWFRYGTSDSRRFYDPLDDTLIRVRGLGLIDAVVSPHHVSEAHRRHGLIDLMRRTPGVGLALDDLAAIAITDSRYCILSADTDAGVSRVYRWRGEVMYRRIEGDRVEGELSELLGSAEGAQQCRCARHGWESRGASPPFNLMEVKDTQSARTPP